MTTYQIASALYATASVGFAVCLPWAIAAQAGCSRWRELYGETLTTLEKTNNFVSDLERDYAALKASHDFLDLETDSLAAQLAAADATKNQALDILAEMRDTFCAALEAEQGSANYWKHQHDLRVMERDAAQEALAPFRNTPRGEHGHFVGRVNGRVA